MLIFIWTKRLLTILLKDLTRYIRVMSDREKKKTFSEWITTAQSATTGSASVTFGATIGTNRSEENKKLQDLFRVIGIDNLL